MISSFDSAKLHRFRHTSTIFDLPMIIPNVTNEKFSVTLQPQSFRFMYTLNELYTAIGAPFEHEIWNGKIACTLNDSRKTLLVNRMENTLNSYTFTLILA